MGVSGECFDCKNSQVSSANDNDFSASLDYIVSAWPELPPHIRETIMTLISNCNMKSVET